MHARAAAAIALVACALSACGDEGDKRLSEDVKQIHATLNEALTTKDPDSCTRLATQTFVEQTTAERGKAALRSCRNEVARSSAQEVSFGRVVVSGPRASADLRTKGGRLPYKTVRFGLRKAAGRWKLDRAKRATLDRGAFLRFLRTEVTSPPDALDDAAADCVVRDFEQREDDEIVRALLKPDVSLFLLSGAICTVRSKLAGTGTPESVITCVARRLRREFTSGALGRRLKANRTASLDAVLDSPRSQRSIRRVFASCARG